MVKPKYEKELEEQSQATLVYICEGKRLPHTGDRDTLIARLVEAEKVEPKQAVEPEPPEE